MKTESCTYTHKCKSHTCMCTHMHTAHTCTLVSAHMCTLTERAQATGVSVFWSFGVLLQSGACSRHGVPLGAWSGPHRLAGKNSTFLFTTLSACLSISQSVCLSCLSCLSCLFCLVLSLPVLSCPFLSRLVLSWLG